MEGLSHGVEELLHELSTLNVNGEPVLQGQFVLTNYVFFMLIALTLTLVFFIIASRKVSLVPRGIANVAEVGVEFVRDGICGDIIGHEGHKYFPFIGSMFFFVLFNNLMGLIPGFKPGTGTMGVTVALAMVVFVVFNGVGIKKVGIGGYLKSFLPGGVPIFLAPLVWFLEVLSALLRPFTLSVRLFANMYAGHIILGIFAILIHLAVEPMIEHFSAGTIVGALPALIWLILMIALYALEVFVAFIQAYVFAVLTAVYIGGAVHAGEH